ncbi:hypothetical protein [Rhodopirellula sp. MGV]|uniref:hypothetical protein n=1 Tax=Rhodopirellula sp. MGV TaxID=2023130 RepID=UPI000B972C89|nr:hypothetical protein [Rhodopirellula sp. MGV]OYP33952.1 hypothetical protein CGZ80_17395 [Rhodopirellula sp. MGV]PNY34065.1 hypothetical protein C2E31_25000 [Rhodopirellula baltica]
MNRITAVLVVSLLVAKFAAAETATLKMRFVFDGDPPPRKPINGLPAGLGAAAPIESEHLIVGPKTKGIKNVVVYLSTGRGAAEIEIPTSKPQTRTMSMANFRFDPHVLIAHTGDTLELAPKDQVTYAPNIMFFKNPASGLYVPPGKPHRFSLRFDEPAPVPVNCNVHSWMRAYVVVLNHPFAAVSDAEGELTISGLPPGRTLAFRVFHEAGRVSKVKLAGVETEWSRQRFEVDLVPGLNDLGEIHVSPEMLAR